MQRVPCLFTEFKIIVAKPARTFLQRKLEETSQCLRSFSSSSLGGTQMRIPLLAIVVATAITFVAPAQAQVVNGTHGPDDTTPAPIGTKAAGSPAPLQGADAAR